MIAVTHPMVFTGNTPDIGCHHANGTKDWWHADSELQQIYILRSHQRMGIGTELFSMIVDWLRELESTALALALTRTIPIARST